MAAPNLNASASDMRVEKRGVAFNSVLAATAITALKVVVGITTGSLGILSEAAHSGLDLIAAFITLRRFVAPLELFVHILLNQVHRHMTRAFVHDAHRVSSATSAADRSPCTLSSANCASSLASAIEPGRTGRRRC